MSANFWFLSSDYHKQNKFPSYHKSVSEEPEISLSLYCAGYDLFYPINKNILYHRVSESNNPNNKIHYREEVDRSGGIRYVKNWNVDDYPMYLETCLLLLTGKNKYWECDTIRKAKDYWAEIGLSKNYGKVLKELLIERNRWNLNEQ